MLTSNRGIISSLINKFTFTCFASPRYIEDFHPSQAWRSAAAEARKQLQQALDETWRDPRLGQVLAEAEWKLSQSVLASVGDSQPSAGTSKGLRSNRGASGRGMVPECKLSNPAKDTERRSAQGWLGAVRHLLRQRRGTGTSVGSSTAEAASALIGIGDVGSEVKEERMRAHERSSSLSPPHRLSSDLQHALQSCTRAFQVLSSHPSLQPALLMHPLQEEVLRSWLQPNTATNAATNTTRNTFTKADDGHDNINQEDVADFAGGADVAEDAPGGTSIGASILLPDGSLIPTEVLMYNCTASGRPVSLHLGDLLLDR